MPFPYFWNAEGPLQLHGGSTRRGTNLCLFYSLTYSAYPAQTHHDRAPPTHSPSTHRSLLLAHPPIRRTTDTPPIDPSTTDPSARLPNHPPTHPSMHPLTYIETHRYTNVPAYIRTCIHAHIQNITIRYSIEEERTGQSRIRQDRTGQDRT